MTDTPNKLRALADELDAARENETKPLIFVSEAAFNQIWNINKNVGCTANEPNRMVRGVAAYRKQSV